MPKKWRVPVDENGNMLRYGAYKNKEYRENSEWVDELRYIEYHRGRSAVFFEFRSLINKRRYYMFACDLDELIKKGALGAGIVRGIWTFVKRGSNYGVKYVGETNAKTADLL